MMPAAALASVTDPLGATTTFTYSPDGHLATQTDPTGAVTTLVHDGSGRLVERTAPGVSSSFCSVLPTRLWSMG